MNNFARVVLVLFVVMCGARGAWADLPNQDGSTIACSSATDTQFVPSWGEVDVGADSYGKYIIQYMYWDSYARLYWFTHNGDSTYEPDALFGGPNGETPYGYFSRSWFAYGSNSDYGYWASDLPSPYQDTAWGDTGSEWAVTVGSAQASLLTAGKLYYTITDMIDGGVSSGKVKLSSQRGRRAVPTTPSWVGTYSKWNSYGCSSTPANVFTLKWDAGFTAPGCRSYWYKWPDTGNGPC